MRALAAERRAVILAHNYQVPEVQDVADYVGDSLGLSRRAAAAVDAETIVFCGVHFMAETASILCPEKTRSDPRPRRRLLAGPSRSSVDAAARRGRPSTPTAWVVMYVNTTAEVKALTDYCCTSANAVDVVRHIYDTHGADTEILFGPDMWLGAYVEKELGRRNARVGRRVPRARGHPPRGHRGDTRRAPRRGLPDPPRVRLHDQRHGVRGSRAMSSAEGVHMLSTGGMLDYAATPSAKRASRAGRARREVVVATETGMLHPLRMAAPDVEFIPGNAEASCVYMKMITLPKLRDALREMKFEVRVPEDVAVRARVPIDRMVAIG